MCLRLVISVRCDHLSVIPLFSLSRSSNSRVFTSSYVSVMPISCLWCIPLCFFLVVTVLVFHPIVVASASRSRLSPAAFVPRMQPLSWRLSRSVPACMGFPQECSRRSRTAPRVEGERVMAAKPSVQPRGRRAGAVSQPFCFRVVKVVHSSLFSTQYNLRFTLSLSGCNLNRLRVWIALDLVGHTELRGGVVAAVVVIAVHVVLSV